MSFFGKWNTLALTVMLLAVANGCSPMDSGSMDEEKEPHYMLGQSRVHAMDYDGAVKAFEEALEANPHSAAAHYQLAMLCENQESDPAGAIYHYQQYLKYDPQADNAEIIRQHIASCKQQLAADVLQLPSAPAAQQQIEKLTEENRRLHEQLAQWQAYYAAQQAAAKTNSPIVQPASAYTPPQQPASSTPDDITPTPKPTPAKSTERKSTPTRTARTRSHTVASGETMASIARHHGISLSALEEANPSVNPRKLRAGQVLNLPSP